MYEAFKLEIIRGLRGAMPLDGVYLSLHGAMGVRGLADLADFFVGYKTNPHRDFVETGYAAGTILIRAVRGEVEPVMVVRKMRLLKGGGMIIDFLPPMNRVFREMDRMERNDGMLSVSVFMVQLWARP